MGRSMATMVGGWAALALFAAAAGGMSGCASHRAFNVEVSLHEGLRDARTGRMPSVELDLIAMSQDDLELAEVTVEEHFSVSGNAAHRREALREAGRLVTMRFGEDRPEPQRLLRTDPLWKSGNGTDLLVLVDYLPAARAQSDLRRLLPRDSDRWRATDRDLRIELRPASLHVTPQPQAGRGGPQDE